MMCILFRLFRIRLALLNGVAALGGYFLFPASMQIVNLSAAFCGVTLLAMGGSALNQLLERDIDALMVRTMMRPLPQGRLSGFAAFLLGAGTILAGLFLLAVMGGLLPALLGALALAWYLAVYTPLKRITTLALPLGALCGAFTPLIGWSLAGGDPSDSRIVILAGLLFIWQIPHFWLLQDRHAADYRLAGIPLVDFRTRGAGPVSIFLVWVAALTAATMLLSLLGGIDRHMIPLFLIIALIPPLVAMNRFERLLFPAFSLFPLAMTTLLLLHKLI
ncbi:MAG: UbiA family prenyltransferase [Pelobacteraceae bacterium]